MKKCIINRVVLVFILSIYICSCSYEYIQKKQAYNYISNFDAVTKPITKNIYTQAELYGHIAIDKQIPENSENDAIFHATYIVGTKQYFSSVQNNIYQSLDSMMTVFLTPDTITEQTLFNDNANSNAGIFTLYMVSYQKNHVLNWNVLEIRTDDSEYQRTMPIRLELPAHVVVYDVTDTNRSYSGKVMGKIQEYFYEGYAFSFSYKKDKRLLERLYFMLKNNQFVYINFIAHTAKTDTILYQFSIPNDMVHKKKLEALLQFYLYRDADISQWLRIEKAMNILYT